MRYAILLIPVVYLAGIAFGVANEYMTFRSHDAEGSFALMDAVTYAGYWPLRVMSFLV